MPSTSRRSTFRIAVIAALLLAAVAAAGCSTGVTAPEAVPGETVCSEGFCVTPPSGWDVDVGNRYVGFAHPAGEGEVLATVGRVDMEGVVRGDGGVWPARPERVVRHLWALLDQGDGAGLDELVVRDDGSVRSLGTLGGGRFWHLLIPIGDGEAFGVEMRAPNTTWEGHADVFFSEFVVTP